MKAPLAGALALALLIFSGCSDRKTETEADKKDHVLRQQIDVMNDAKSVQKTLNKSTQAQDEQAAKIAGHE